MVCLVCVFFLHRFARKQIMRQEHLSVNENLSGFKLVISDVLGSLWTAKAAAKPCAVSFLGVLLQFPFLLRLLQLRILQLRRLPRSFGSTPRPPYPHPGEARLPSRPQPWGFLQPPPPWQIL